MTDPNAQPDKAMLPRSLIIAALAIIAVGLVGLILAAVPTANWVGRTDLEVQFLVTDANTGLPVPRATIQIHNEEDFRGDGARRNFTLISEQNGYAKQMLKNCTSGGKSGLFEDTYTVGLPWWSFRASSKGYSDSNDTLLHDPEFSKAVKRGPPFATVLIPIRLERSE